MTIDYQRQRSTADRMIRKYGHKAKLRRTEGDRDCYACFVQFNPHNAQGRMINATDRLALVSAVNVDVAPDAEKDRLVTLDPSTNQELEVLRIMAPVGRLAPAEIIIYWELQVRR